MQTESANERESSPRDTAAEQYTLIRHELLVGHYPPGTLLRETALSAKRNVSRTPVREALARLEQDGLLSRAPRGYRVRHRTANEVLDIYEARIILESHAAATAVVRHTPLDLAKLRSVLALARSTDDPEALWLNDTEFHHALRAAAHNDVIAEVLERLDAQVTIHGPYVRRRAEGAQITRSEHERIVEAIADRDAVAARAHMEAHLNRVRDLRIVSLLEEQEDGG
ncbi:putative GntR family transcriptional regulator [Actinacidiphila reveromycinica]|uniref:Putative GntR family transcriptional regulator n=1 Tax=Actinacidiphila reveromycinica TaxID=659352 RepID=A0A7U3UZ25_9ACTN|nr:GntR family transcriptional regulator [Streptomyces sp. SN-593]BBB01478.1 putative GntR family transcriptional regulator [Streptomyces sp. SN-593]